MLINPKTIKMGILLNHFLMQKYAHSQNPTIANNGDSFIFPHNQMIPRL